MNNVPREVVDHRGLVYRKEDGGQQIWGELGELPDAFTREPWPGNYHIWKDPTWQFDAESQLSDVKAQVFAERDALLRDAVLRIAPAIRRRHRRRQRPGTTGADGVETL